MSSSKRIDIKKITKSYKVGDSYEHRPADFSVKLNFNHEDFEGSYIKVDTNGTHDD